MNTYGEILVGASFNPSGDSSVTYVKNECAKLIDLSESLVNEKLKEFTMNLSEDPSSEEDVTFTNKTSSATLLHDMVVQNLLIAQTMLVKLITLPTK